MKKYPLQRLLQVRLHREQEAQAELTRCRRVAEEARIAAEKARMVAETFSRERPQKEAALFEEIRNQVLNRKEVDAYHAKIQALVAREVDLHDAASAAKARHTEAEKAVEEALERLRLAILEVKKFEEHRQRWLIEEMARIEAAEEQEIEEAAGQRSSGQKQ